MDPKILTTPVAEEEFQKILEEHPRMMKLAVDIEKNIVCYDCEMHVDCYNELIEQGSDPKYVWGAGIYSQDRTVDYSSMMNRRLPENRSMEIEDTRIRAKVLETIKKFFPL